MGFKKTFMTIGSRFGDEGFRSGRPEYVLQMLNTFQNEGEGTTSF